MEELSLGFLGQVSRGMFMVMDHSKLLRLIRVQERKLILKVCALALVSYRTEIDLHTSST